MRGLIKNEFTKVLKQTGYRVLLVIFAVYLIAVPFLTLLENSLLSGELDAQEIYDSHISNAEFYAEQGMTLESEYWYDYAESVEFFLDNSLDSWKLNYLLDGEISSFFPNFESTSDGVYSFSDFYLRAAGFDLLAGGELTPAQLYSSNYCFYIWEYFSTEDFYFDGKDWLDMNENVIPDPHTRDDVMALRDNARRELDELSQLIVECDAKQILVDYREYTASLENGAKNKYDALTASGAEVGEIFTAERTYDIYKMIREMFDVLVEETDSLDDWRYGFTLNVLQALNVHQSYSNYPVDIDTFVENKAYEYYMYDSYEDYVKDLEADRDEAEAGLKVAHYAVINNVSPEGVGSNTKLNLRNNIESASKLIVIFTIVLAGMIVASEFSSGTVRLLLIRPKKRWKIMLSKLICVLGFYIGLILISTIALNLLGVAIYGVGDIFTPDLDFVGGRVVEIPAVVETFYLLVLLAVQSLPVICLAFMLSVRMKKSALALVVSFVVHSLSGAVQTTSLLLLGEMPFLKYTILPYLSLTDFRFCASDVVIQNIAMSYFDLDMILGALGTSLSSSEFSAILAIVIVLAHAGAFTAIAFASFKKQQIQN